MHACIEQGWGRDILAAKIKSNAHERQGAAVTNFDRQLPAPHAQLAQNTLKDPYIFDFLTLDEPSRERELEAGLVKHLERFLLELGAGFAFVGRQMHLEVGEEDFYPLSRSRRSYLQIFKIRMKGRFELEKENCYEDFRGSGYGV